MWSLDGKEEITETGDCEIELKETKRCASCPYNSDTAASSCVKDIENLKSCDTCPEKNPAKKIKLDSIPVELLKNDPHEQCPVSLPVGVDFMGKCPYLEANSGNSPASNTIEGAELLKQCPFLKQANLSEVQPSSSESNTFCGLVPHGDTPLESLKQAQDLGFKLAEALLKKGAGEVMAKAQATIHGTAS